jgi:Mg2+ and Co2+ transporter CorA
MFDPQDELYKLVDRFNQFAVQEIASQVSHISVILEKQHRETHTAIEGVSRDVGLLRRETMETSQYLRRTSDLLEKMVAGKSRVPTQAYNR